MLLDAQGKVIEKTGSVAPLPKNSPEKEITKVLAMVEVAGRGDLAQCCATLDGIAQLGWNLAIDERVPEMQAEVVVIMRMRRDANNPSKITQRPERWVGLGAGFHQALQIVIEERKKQAELVNAQHTQS